MDTKAYAVILAGGKGERFWPLSTSKHPKQFLSLVGDKPLLAQAVDRLDGVIPPERVLVITNGDLVDVARRSAAPGKCNR
jgi:mannose-1-phosphate guanylyltransferase